MKRIIGVAVIAIIIQLSASAGPPLICHPINIGNAKSLPWGSIDRGTNATDPNYNINNLIKDTLELLTSGTPVLVRMETLRRAAIYATLSPSKNEKIADDMLSALMDRVNSELKQDKTPGLALFDAGYFVSCYEQTGYFKEYSKNKPLGNNLDGYTMIKKGVESYRFLHKTENEAELEFALALASYHPKLVSHKTHLQKAIAGAKEGSLLATNIKNHFGKFVNS